MKISRTISHGNNVKLSELSNRPSETQFVEPPLDITYEVACVHKRWFLRRCPISDWFTL